MSPASLKRSRTQTDWGMDPDKGCHHPAVDGFTESTRVSGRMLDLMAHRAGAYTYDR